jgi:hypothetical protein
VSRWPSDGKELDDVVAYLKGNGSTDARYQAGGLCEPLSIFLASKDTIQRAGSNPTPDAIHKAAVEILEEKNINDACELVLGGLVKSRFNKTPGDWGDHVDGEILDYLYGTPSMCTKIGEAAKSGTCHAIPMYIICYLFDVDELNDEEMKCKLWETAQYSCHVLAIYFDPIEKKAVILDTNGPLNPGGSMEFVKFPREPLPGKATTAISRYDRENQKAEH